MKRTGGDIILLKQHLRAQESIVCQGKVGFLSESFSLFTLLPVAYEDNGVLYIYGVSDFHTDHKLTLKVSDTSSITLMCLARECQLLNTGKLNEHIFI